MFPDLIDSVELERAVNSLNQELAASRKAEEELQARLQELDQVDGLLKQVGGDGDGDGGAHLHLLAGTIRFSPNSILLQFFERRFDLNCDSMILPIFSLHF